MKVGGMKDKSEPLAANWATFAHVQAGFYFGTLGQGAVTSGLLEAART